MLRNLTIENYVLIDHLDVSFPGGLVIITGETGAGKSILLGALSLLLGTKADVSSLMDPTRNCVVEASFIQNGEEHYVRRVVSPNGRSRAFFDDEPVTIDFLRETTMSLVDIHSQNQQLLLSQREFRLGVLDSYAGNSEALENCRKSYDAWQQECARLAQARTAKSAFDKEREYLEFQCKRLDDAKLVEDELEELEAEQLQLANSELIKECFDKAGYVFDDGESSLDSGLKDVIASLTKISDFVPGADDLCRRVESCRIELKDISDEIVGRGEKVVFNPARLQEVDDRIALLYELIRIMGVEDIHSLITLRDELHGKLSLHQDDDQELSALEKSCESLERMARAAAVELHDSRMASAPLLSGSIEERIHSLEMPSAVFKVEINEKELGRDGVDEVSLLFNANGRDLQDLSKCASGGEFSRIMLALKSEMCRHTGMPTMIFDEIDTGVSGSIADKMGRMIVEMGRTMQVFAITHLPQVASKGDAHYLVYKHNDGTGVRSSLKQLEGDERVCEIARLLSGETLTDEAMANARVLLEKYQ